MPDYSRQQAGTIDRIFNSTIGLPQQVIWRIIRAISDDDIDLWDEKGLLDAALIPGLGVLDSHEHDVMPDYMAETMGLAEEGKSGLGSQLTAAILTDPLMLLTGGASALGKLGKAAERIKTHGPMKEVLTKAALKANVRNVDDYVAGLTPAAYRAHIDEALKVAGTKEAGKLLKVSKQFDAAEVGAKKAAGLKDISYQTIGDAIKNTSDRRLAIGLPILQRFGARYDIPVHHNSWYQVFKAGINSGGRSLGKAFLLKDLVKLPYLGATLKGSVMPFRHGMFGLKHGQDASAVIPATARSITPDEAKGLVTYLSEDGGRSLALRVEEEITTNPDLITDIQGVYTTAIKANKTHGEAFREALVKTGIISPSSDEAVESIWGRLAGKTKANTEFPDWGAGFASGKDEISKLFTDFRANHRKAAAVLDSGEAALVPVKSEARKLDRIFEVERSEANALLGGVAEIAYQIGKGFRGMINTAFKTGGKSLFNQKASNKLLSDAARDNDNLEVMSTAFYAQLAKIAEDSKSFSLDDINKIVELRTELGALPDEIAASFKAFEINSSDPTAVLSSLKNYLDRHRSTLTTFEKLLKNKGIGTETSRRRLLAAFQDEVFPFIERDADDLFGAETTLVGRVSEAAEEAVTTVIDYTPLGLARLNNVAVNRHVVGGEVLPVGGKQAEHAVPGLYVPTRNTLGDLAGKQAGTLTDAEIDSVLTTIGQRGMRKLSDIEILNAARKMPALKQFAKRNKLTIEESIALLQSHRKGRKTRIVERATKERAIPLWDRDRTRWSSKQADDALADYGLSIELNSKGKLELHKRYTGPHTLPTQIETLAVKKGFRTYAEAMRSAHRFINKNKSYADQFGPPIINAKKRLSISATEITDLQAALARGGSDLEVVSGKFKRFDDRLLPETLKADWTRLNELSRRRRLKPTDDLFENGPIVGTERQVKRAARQPGQVKDVRRVREGVPDIPVSSTMSAYAHSRVLLHEIKTAVERAERQGVPFKLDETIMADLEQHMNQTGTAIMDAMDAVLPKQLSKTFEIAKLFAGYSFQAARRSGTWLPGSPIAYLPRFFTKKGREKVSKLVGQLDAEDGSLLARLGVKQRQYFKRDFDNLTIDDLESMQEELRKIVTEKTASPKLKRLHAELDKELKESGIGVTGLKGKQPVQAGRLERDPFMSLIQRLGVAQQHDNLADYFEAMLKEGTTKTGDSLMLGGKVIGVVDNVGQTRRLPLPTTTTTVATGKGGRELTVARTKEELTYTPRQLLVETTDGKIHTIENGMLDDTGFGILNLQEGLDDVAVAAGAETRIGNAFAHASMRSDLHNSISQGKLTDEAADLLLGRQVVVGSRNHMISAIKSSAEIHKVGSRAIRTFDSINYMIKSFQTIFRLPFHIANLSSGVFQASLAGAGPKNIAASYIDTIRLLFGNQDFAKRSSQLADLLDLGANTSSNGIINLLKGNKSRIQQATRMAGGGKFSKYLTEQLGESIDAMEHLVLKHADGTQTDLKELIQIAGEMGLYGTFASSLTRGSAIVSDNLMRTKIAALDPGAESLVKRGTKYVQNIAETSEVINRTATAIALVREGHPMRRAIEIAKEAHVPYEKLTSFERNKIKRLSVYYTFPRHYLPWATARFAEDPAKLARLSHMIRDQTTVTRQEGKPMAAIGNYRIDIGRLNANLEAANVLAAFADRLVMPGVELFTAKATDLDRRFLHNAQTTSGLTTAGGIAGLVFDDLLPQGHRTSFGSKNMFKEAAEMIWPIKTMAQIMGYRPSKEEQSPYVNYTTLEKIVTHTAIGVGIKKVRDDHEFIRTKHTYKRLVRSMKLKMAATNNPETRARYAETIRELTLGLGQMYAEGQQKK